MGDTTRYDPAVAAAVAQFTDVPFSWVKAVIGAESSFNDVAPQWAPLAGEYSYGPMQVLLSTAQGIGFQISADQLQDPTENILVGTAFISSLGETDFSAMYSAYNSGSDLAYLSSSQVASNVQRALGWLQQFGGPTTNPNPSGGSGDVVFAVALVAAVWFLWPRRKAVLSA